MERHHRLMPRSYKRKLSSGSITVSDGIQLKRKKFQNDQLTSNRNLGGSSLTMIPDRFIPNETSIKAYRASPNLQNFDLTINELADPDSQRRLPSPEFFTSQDLLLNQLILTPDQSPLAGKEVKTRLNEEFKRHREYIADALGFQSPERVYKFDRTQKTLGISPNHSIVDPLLSTLPPKDAAQYIHRQEFPNFEQSRRFVPCDLRPKKRTKSHIPYRVLDAPALRNDFYSNLVDWSPATNNVVVGLNCSVYLWSDTLGPINVLHHGYLQRKGDIVTCVSFAPTDDYLVVATKLGRLLVFDQSYKPKVMVDGSRQPLVETRINNNRGICCVKWFQNTKNEFLLGNDIGEVHRFRLEHKKFEHFEIITMGEAERRLRVGKDLNGHVSGVERVKQKSYNIKETLVKYVYETMELCLESVYTFQSQTQQVCGLDISEETGYVAVGGNDNSCSLWDISLPNGPPKLLFQLSHYAAVKAVSFCPWSKSLLATGGGSKDRTIRFWHAPSGTLLKEIKTPGQITSLIWSTRRKQIVATFGFSDLESPTLFISYSYPSMEPIMKVTTPSALRVLSAVSSPDFSNICIATNDETVRFYEMWDPKESTIIEAQASGLYGSEIIEHEEGIEHDTVPIR
ncbi:HBL259Cp [Eremothecium sinecaudum]|uniref:HBL259Cp n=1 Tax=Eremothecium sinecaudum TaxID=45286 RepID=A0A109UW47_9SACH|nr:HBL259Cp [Eremothecium sinecaudum]AMD18643.1 HBL259Cp [Eremothecium sinecaudum]